MPLSVWLSAVLFLTCSGGFAAAQCVVEGTVHWQDQKPASGVTVVIIEEGRTTKANDDGCFSFPDVKAASPCLGERDRQRPGGRASVDARHQGPSSTLSGFRSHLKPEPVDWRVSTGNAASASPSRCDRQE